MNARLSRRFGVVLAAFTVAGCAMQPDGDTVGQATSSPDALRTNRAEVAQAHAGGKPSFKESLAGLLHPSLSKARCHGVMAGSDATGSDTDCLPDQNGSSIVKRLAKSAAGADEDNGDDDDTLASADDGSLAGAAPLMPGEIPDVSRFHQTGNASWYGRRFHGRRTASGERYDMHEFTAAHRSLPLQSYIRVTNTENHKSVVVKVNDRGPFHSHRILDLSLAAAQAIGMTASGTERVSITGLSPAQARAAMADQVLASR